jgi:hypothetical protein
MTTISLSQSTFRVLKNFAQINPSIVVEPGSDLRSIVIGEHLIAHYECEENFPQAFAIYDLYEFLNGLQLFFSTQNSEVLLKFENKDYLEILSGTRKTKYYFSDPELTIKTAPNKRVEFPGADIEFDLIREDLIGIQKAADVYKLKDLVFVSEGNRIYVEVTDLDDETSIKYTQDLKGTSTGDFRLNMKVDNLKIMSDDYTVKVSDQFVTEWKNKSIPLTYWIALEPSED